MCGRILVSLRGSDRVEEFLPYIEQVAQPGMKIVFLIHCGWSGFKGFLEQLPAVYPGIMPTLLPGRSNKESELLRLLEKEISNRCGALRKQGLEITVDVHTRPLHKVVRQCIQRQDVHLVIMRAGFYDRITQYMRNVRPLSRLLKPSFPPVLLLHPENL